MDVEQCGTALVPAAWPVTQASSLPVTETDGVAVQSAADCPPPALQEAALCGI